MTNNDEEILNTMLSDWKHLIEESTLKCLARLERLCDALERAQGSNATAEDRDALTWAHWDADAAVKERRRLTKKMWADVAEFGRGRVDGGAS